MMNKTNDGEWSCATFMFQEIFHRIQKLADAHLCRERERDYKYQKLKGLIQHMESPKYKEPTYNHTVCSCHKTKDVIKIRTLTACSSARRDSNCCIFDLTPTIDFESPKILTATSGPSLSNRSKSNFFALF
jgi:hypothetical protein